MFFLAVKWVDDTGEAYKASLEAPMSPLAFLLIAILALIVLTRSRAAAVAAVVAAVAYLPQTEVLNIGFHFYAVRLVLLAGIIRLFIRGEHRDFRFGKLDKALFIYAGVIFVIASLRAPEELTPRLGGLYDLFLSYFLFRCLLRNEEDFRLALSRVAYAIIPFAGLMIYETMTNHNPFSLFNGITANSWIRNGHTRAEGPFRNPITAGSFGATFAMLYAGLFFSGVRKRFVLVGFLAAAAIVLSSHSSGPFLGLALGLLAFFCWRWQRHLKQILYGVVALLLVLQVVMSSPVWFLIAKVSDVTGGGGYHRAMLIEQTVHYFDRWWLAGTVETSDWFPYEMNGKADITNWFVAAAVDAGLLGLFAAVSLVVTLFKTLGASIAANPEPRAKKLLWGIGATLVGSLGILFSVTYMDQMQIVWYLLLASIATLAVRPPLVLTVLPDPLPARKERVEWRERLNSGNVAV